MQLTISILWILGTLICFWLIYTYKLKNPLIWAILSVPFGWLGWLFALIIIIEYWAEIKRKK